jgi:two-component system, OmpR family, sensor histidine kinase SenX3
VFGLIVTLLIGGAVGGIVGFAFARRTQVPPAPVARSQPPVRSPLVPAPTDDAATLREAIKHLEIGVVVSSPSGSILYRNDSASAFSGTHMGVLVDQHIEAHLSAARDGTRSGDLVELHGPPRTWLTIQAESLPGGGAVAITQDVSDRMLMDAMRTDFVTNISHELKTPVGALAVLADAIEGEDDLEVIHRVVRRIVDESHRAVQTIDDLLQLSQIESSRHGDDVVELSSVVQAAISRGRIADGGRGVRVMAIDPPTPIRIYADYRQLASAIGNLVENAVKYSKNNGVVQVRTRVADRHVEIMVADQGIGIPARDLDRIFERFYRVDKARSRDTGGTGLGLAIVRHVATNHGGDVQVSSEEGEGSTFVFRLPTSVIVPTGIDSVNTPDDMSVHPSIATERYE